jgi:uncharacterized protein (DUF2164 family)
MTVKRRTSDEVPKLREYLEKDYLKMIDVLVNQYSEAIEWKFKTVHDIMTAVEKKLRDFETSIDTFERKVVENNSEAVEENFNVIRDKMTEFEARLGDIKRSIDGIERKVVEKNSEAIEEKFKTVQDSMIALEKKLEPIASWS